MRNKWPGMCLAGSFRAYHFVDPISQNYYCLKQHKRYLLRKLLLCVVLCPKSYFALHWCSTFGALYCTFASIVRGLKSVKWRPREWRHLCARPCTRCSVSTSNQRTHRMKWRHSLRHRTLLVFSMNLWRYLESCLSLDHFAKCLLKLKQISIVIL